MSVQTLLEKWEKSNDIDHDSCLYLPWGWLILGIGAASFHLKEHFPNIPQFPEIGEYIDVVSCHQF